jgi:putative ATPase
MRPRTFEEFVGQSHLIGPGRALTRLLEGGHLPSIVLWGPAGTGKTTLAYLLADAVGADLQQLSAVSSGVADARKIMAQARGGLFRTVLFVDEVHRWSKAQQDVLLPAVEEGTVTLIGATTENPYFSLVTPLLSRSILLRLEPLSAEELRDLMRRALADGERGLGSQEVEVLRGRRHWWGCPATRAWRYRAEGGGQRSPYGGEDVVTLERRTDAVRRSAMCTTDGARTTTSSRRS